VQVAWDPRPPVAVADSVLVFEAFVLVFVLLLDLESVLLLLLGASVLLDDFVFVLVLEVSTEEDVEAVLVLVFLLAVDDEVDDDFSVGLGGFSSHTTQCWLE
jgi:hypothetical protein